MAKADRNEWAQRVQRWQDSGLTAREFATEVGLKAASLTYWKWKLRKDHEARDGASVERPRVARRKVSRSMQFVELKSLTTSVGTQDSKFELVIGACMIRVPNEFDDIALRRLLAVVRECA
jgi:transposase